MSARLEWKDVTYHREELQEVKLEWWRTEAPHCRLELQRTHLPDGRLPFPWSLRCDGFFSAFRPDLCPATATPAEAQEAAQTFLLKEVLRRSAELIQALGEPRTATVELQTTFFADLAAGATPTKLQCPECNTTWEVVLKPVMPVSLFPNEACPKRARELETVSRPPWVDHAGTCPAEDGDQILGRVRCGRPLPCPIHRTPEKP